MRFSIIENDESTGIRRVTFPSERWYERRIKISDEDPGVWDFVPSVTWICEAGYVKGIGFYKWLADRGWDEAEALKNAAGDRGSKVHQAIAAMLSGRRIGIDDSFENPTTLQPEPLTLVEWECLMTFVAWFEETKPEVIGFEFTVWNEKYRYAGTVDLLCKIGRRHWLIDFKTSASIWPSMRLQVSAYRHTPTIPRRCSLGILQLNYRLNKRGFKLTEVDDQFPLFLAARKIWEHETQGQVPRQRDFPLSLSLAYTMPIAEPGKPPGANENENRYSEAEILQNAPYGL